MKKTLITVIIVITIILSMSMCYAFNDIENSKYKTAIEKLSQNGIISGYEDNTYKPDKTITRAEMVKLLIASKGIDVINEEVKTSSFIDVGINHWAIKYIEKAKIEGLIKGDGNGNFRPNDTVSYQEAITMIIRNVGYGVLVEGVGTWPDNYVEKAKELKLFDNIIDFTNSSGANRGAVAQMLYNGEEKIKTRNDYELVNMLNQIINIDSKEIIKNNEYNSVKGDITINVNNINEQIEERDKIVNILDNSKLNLDMSFDAVSDYFNTNFEYIFKKESLLNTDLVIDKENMYIFIKDIFEKYLKDEDINLEELDTQTTKEVVQSEDNIKFLQKCLIEGKITKTKENLNIENENITSNKISLKIDDLELIQKEMELEQLEEIAKDDEKIKEKYYLYIRLLNYTLDDAKKMINQDIQELKEEIESKRVDVNHKTEVTVEIFLNNRNQIIGGKILLKKNETYWGEERRIDLNINFVKNNDYTKMTFDYKENDKQIDFDMETKGNQNNKTVFKFKTIEKGIEQFNIDIIGNFELYNKEIKQINKEDVVTELSDEEKEKLEERGLYIVEKWGIKELFEKYIIHRSSLSKEAVFFSTYSTIQDTVTLYKLNYNSEHNGENPILIKKDATPIVISQIKYYPFADDITAEDLNLSNIDLEKWYVSEFGEVIYKSGVKLENGDVLYNSVIKIINGDKIQTVPIPINEYKF